MADIGIPLGAFSSGKYFDLIMAWDELPAFDKYGPGIPGGKTLLDVAYYIVIASNEKSPASNPSAYASTISCGYWAGADQFSMTSQAGGSASSQTFSSIGAGRTTCLYCVKTSDADTYYFAAIKWR